jgi:LysM repeat protein
MNIKSFKILFLIVTAFIALSFVDSIQARTQKPLTRENPLNQVRGQRGLVVEATHTPTSLPGPTAVPIVISTPHSDGMVKHIVGGGQSLWAIVDAYGVPIETLLELNGLEADVLLNIGDELIISPPHTPTSTPIGEPSNTPPPRFSQTPSSGTPQATDPSFSPATQVPTEASKAEPRFRSSVKNPLVIIAAVLVSGASLGAALYFSLRTRE